MPKPRGGLLNAALQWGTQARMRMRCTVLSIPTNEL
jgi:hypothetical protein